MCVLGPGHMMHRVARCDWAETPGGQTGLGMARGRVQAQGGLSHNRGLQVECLAHVGIGAAFKLVCASGVPPLLSERECK